MGRLKSNKIRAQKQGNILKEIMIEAQDVLSDVKGGRCYKQVLCAIIYWCEGAKNTSSGVRFINSDPNLIDRIPRSFAARV